MQIKRNIRQSAHYVCPGCGRPFQTLLKLYGHEKDCKGRKTTLSRAEGVREWPRNPEATS